MSDTWIGIVVASGEITLVNLEFQVDGSPVLNDDTTWALQQGVRPDDLPPSIMPESKLDSGYTSGQ